MVPNSQQAVPDIEPLMDYLNGYDYEIQKEMNEPISFIANTGGIRDTMYFEEAMKQEDAHHFIQAIIKEFNDHVERNHWSLIDVSEVPKGQKVIPSVWSMKRKRDISSRKIVKYKAR